MRWRLWHRAAFSPEPKRWLVESRKWREKTGMKPWAPFHRDGTVAALGALIGLPCWSRHCCFLYWPQLLTASAPLPCCRPGWWGPSWGTPLNLGRGRRGLRGESGRDTCKHKIFHMILFKFRPTLVGLLWTLEIHYCGIPTREANYQLMINQ